MCGDCCRADLIAYFMHSKIASSCRYLADDARCTVRTGEAGKIPIRHFTYYTNECLPYPNPTDPGHMPPRHALLPSCTFKVVTNRG